MKKVLGKNFLEKFFMILGVLVRFVQIGWPEEEGCKYVNG